MKKVTSLLIVFALAAATVAAQSIHNGYPIGMVPFTAVKVDSASLFGQRIAAAQHVTIPLAFSKCASEGRYDNFRKAAQPSPAYDVGAFMGFPFDDTDVYKTIEGASYVLQTYPDATLEAYIDSVLDIVAAAQEDDGYLYTARTINPAKPHPWAGKERWESVEGGSHELYNLGHMLLAACAHYAATGSEKFLNIARRYADCVCRSIGPDEGQRHVVPGHQIAEMGLAQLYLATGEQKYLDEAKYFLSLRGKTDHRDKYSQSHEPVVVQQEAVGHAVRAGYMYAGMADIAALTGDEDYVRAIDTIWSNIVGYKCYLTGGVGARHNGEAFGEAYELPNLTAYNETCAAIAMVYLNYRMFLLHGDAKYIDCLERTLYNAVLCGMSIDGGAFFYVNPLSADGTYAFNYGNGLTRQPWFGCACCPSNLCRFIPSLPGYMYAVRDNDIYVNLYGSNTATLTTDKGNIVLQQTTTYPHEGDITLRIVSNDAGDATLRLRIPGWLRGEVLPSALYHYADTLQPSYSITINGAPYEGSLTDGYVAVCRAWHSGDTIALHFDMPARRVKAAAAVADDRGKEAIERGPIVFCAEEVDNSVDLAQLVLAADAPLAATFLPDTLGGINQITTAGYDSTTGARCNVVLIPYYAWNHRGIGKMAVWLDDTSR